MPGCYPHTRNITLFTSTNSTDGYDVRIETWTDWERGRLFGTSLTLAQHDSFLLVSLLVFFSWLLLALDSRKSSISSLN
jgi:hypothetical protein